MPSLPAADALNAVLSKYRRARLGVARTLEAGKRNDSYIIEDTSGARFVLRRYRRNPLEARIVFQLRFQRELRRKGFPTAEVIETTAGDLVVHEASSVWALFSHV